MTTLKGSPIDLLNLRKKNGAPAPVRITAESDQAGATTSQADVMLRNAQALAPDPDSFILSVDQIEVRKQVREHFDADALAELAASIAAQGQKNPVTVTHLKGSRYLLETGERRLRAIRDVLKRDDIRATIARPKEEDHDYTRELAQLTENIQRENLTKIEEARAIQRLQDKAGWNDNEIAKRMHRSRTWVVRVRSILEAPQSVQDAITNGAISWHSWTTDRDAILAAASTLGARATAEQLLAAYAAPLGSATASESTSRKSGAVEDREPTVSLPLSTAQAILRNFQKIAASHKLELETPKKPSRKQIAELLDSFNKKIGRVL